MGRKTNELKSTGESLAQAEGRKDLQLGMETKQTAWLAAGLSLDQIATLLSAEAKKARKAAKRSDILARMPRSRFQAKAAPVQVTINGQQYLATVRADKVDKSFGWYSGEQVVMIVDGEELECTLGLNITVNGTKPVKE